MKTGATWMPRTQINAAGANRTVESLLSTEQSLNNFLPNTGYHQVLIRATGTKNLQDGAQHLADAAAYRRDRRKDRLLQENGYIVVRFLAGDLAKELDTVLDAILRAVTRRREVIRLRLQ